MDYPVKTKSWELHDNAYQLATRIAGDLVRLRVNDVRKNQGVTR
jgi:hypothetical protein